MEQKSDATPKPGSKPRLRLGLSTPGLRRHRKENNEETETPRATTLPLRAKSNSCKRPGLGLPRKELTKKRLQFVKVEENREREVQKDAESTNTTKVVKVEENREREVQKDAESTNTTKDSRTVELEKDIEIWRNAFVASMDDLQASVEPRQSKKSLLIQLGIPLEMLPYLEED